MNLFREFTIQLISTILIVLLLTNQADAVEPVDFERQIRPLLLEKCGECHGATTQRSGLRIDARHGAFKGGDGGPAIVPGKADQSELFRRVITEAPDERMPPEQPPLKKDEIELLRRWINSGANWPESDYDREARLDKRLQHWAFQPVQSTAAGQQNRTGNSTRAGADQIDQFVQAKLAEQNLKPSMPADRRTLIRRLYFDMVGLPPTPEEVAEFVAAKNPEAFRQLIEKLLDSPRYGERWAQHWLDVVRYADTHGFEVNTPRENAWPYRDYVIRSFNDDKPYDQFVREQLAGDAFDEDAATGFLVAAAVLLPGQIGKDEESKRLARQDALDEMIVGTSATFLGLTIGCARCHDHKFDPISAKDYYALQAFFAGVSYGDRQLRNERQRERLAEAKKLEPQINELNAKLQTFEPVTFTGRTLIIDEEDEKLVTILKTPNGPGSNPAGKSRGYRDDVGSAERVGNLSRGRYTWWNNVPGENVLTYNPGVDGQFDLWLSWGAHGSGVHTRDARYVLDKDGDLTTTADQRELASVDQYFVAGLTEGTTEKKPLWSGLAHVGSVALQASSKLVVRGGETGTGITADVIVLQESAPQSDVSQPAPKENPTVFSGTKLPQLRAPVNSRINTERFTAVSARFLRFTTFETIDNNKHQPCIDELEVFGPAAPAQNVALAPSGTKATSSGNYSETGKHQLKHVNDGKYSNDRSWISNKYGGGWVQFEFPDEVQIDRVVWGRDRTGKFPDRLPVRYRIDVSLDGEQWSAVASHTDRVPMGTPYDSNRTLLRNRPSTSGENSADLIAKLDALKKQKTELEKVPVVYAGQFNTPNATYVLRRGDPQQRLGEIGPAVPALFASNAVSENASEQQRRIALSDWVASPDNPLTARVMVNRIWQCHFGRGLVATSSDFGLNGTRPTHPKLLDWLAEEFIASGWSVKHVHRLILLSQTWQQSSFVDRQAAIIDADNKWLWRFPSRRLEGEAIRDCMLSVSGELNLKMGGPGFNFFKSRGGLSGFPPVEKFSSNELRRMIYSHKIRMERVPVFGAFDCPDAGQATPRRTQSTTAIQALNLFNSPFVAERAGKLAERLQKQHADAPTAQISRGFELALGREPSAVELSESQNVVREYGLATLCRVLFNSNEFLFIP